MSDQPSAAEILASLWEQLKLAGDITDKNMALMDQLRAELEGARKERQHLADLLKLFELLLNETSLKFLSHDILATVQDFEQRKNKKMPGGFEIGGGFAVTDEMLI